MARRDEQGGGTVGLVEADLDRGETAGREQSGDLGGEAAVIVEAVGAGEQGSAGSYSATPGPTSASVAT